VAFGSLLLVAAVAHHARELVVLDERFGPVLALLLDGAPAVVLVYAGVQLSRTELTARGRWRVVHWGLGGSLVFAAAIGATIAVRTIEGRAVGEPVFTLLVAVEAGAIAGLVAGYYNARARADSRRARRVSGVLGFVNDLLRHDLRNDLHMVREHAELVAEEYDAEDAAGDPGTIVEKSDEALRRIGTTRAVADTLVGEADLEPVDLASMTASLAEQVDATFDVRVTTALPEEASVTANDGLRSAVDNLLENAAEHNDADDPRIDVTVETVEDTARLLVSDNGPGIPDEEKQALLAPAKVGRAGHGLSLVRTLVEGYGGTVRIEDNEPRGTTVIVELPRAETT